MARDKLGQGKGEKKKKWDWSGLRWSEENDAQGLTKSADVKHANEGETEGLAQAGGVAFQHCGECGFMNALWLESFSVFLFRMLEWRAMN